MKAGIEGEDHRMRQVRSASGIAGRTVRTVGQVGIDCGFGQTAWNHGRSSPSSDRRLTCLVYLPLLPQMQDSLPIDKTGSP